MTSRRTPTESLPATVYNSNGTFFEFQYLPTADDLRYMGLALDMARTAIEHGDNPVGSVLHTPFGEFKAHTTEHLEHDSEAHAEKNVYKAALLRAREIESTKPNQVDEQFGLDLGRCILYSTAELCVGCSHLYDQVGIGMVLIGATREDVPEFFRKKPINMRSIWQNSPRTLTVVEGLRRAESIDLLTGKNRKHT